MARIICANVPNLQSSWVTMGLKVGQVALRFGANDFGSLMMEENVVSAAGTTYRDHDRRHGAIDPRRGLRAAPPPPGLLPPRRAAAGRRMIRVGIGYDSHRFAADRPLVLGGVTIPGAMGLAGHSDGDAVAHAVADALLGALALGDLGQLFPDSDPVFRGADSIELLRQIRLRVRDAGWVVHNVDATVITEAPRLGPTSRRCGNGWRRRSMPILPSSRSRPRPTRGWDSSAGARGWR